jgi:hypothetical protein
METAPDNLSRVSDGASLVLPIYVFSILPLGLYLYHDVVRLDVHDRADESRPPPGPLH